LFDPERAMGFFLIFLLIITPQIISQPLDGMISGRVQDAQTGEPLPLCNITLFPGNGGLTTDSLGLFAISLKFDIYILEFSYTGYETDVREVTISAGSPRVRILIELEPFAFKADEVVVLGQSEKIAPDVQTIDRVDVRRIPGPYSDVLRSIKILPGVTSNNELSSAYNVRGGNFDENLVYLNGHQIFRPYLLRMGVEENQSLLNPDMIQSVDFYAGGFPARFGDRMSSVLEATYLADSTADIKGIVRGDLLNMGMALQGRWKKLSWSLGVRYANPSAFVNKLQTSGDYRPSYSDIQLLMSYQPNENRYLEMLLLYADNKFDLTPRLWQGNFKFSQYDVRGIDIEYSGTQLYTFQTGLLGLKWEEKLASHSRLYLRLSGFRSGEEEERNLTSDIYYIPDSREPGQNRQYLKTRYENADNHLDLTNGEVEAGIFHKLGIHQIRSGIVFKFNRVNHYLNEKFEESSDNNSLEPVHYQFRDASLQYNQFEWYAEDVFLPFSKFQLNAGTRFLFYDYTNEHLFSPRLSLHYFLADNHTLYLRWGFYYQPPYLHELRYQSIGKSSSLSSQRSIHYILGWDHQLNPDLDLQIEVYYKKLDRLIPYYLEDLQLIYANRNSNKGFARGIDILIRGEIVKGLNSWIGYSYLDTRERPTEGGTYWRRLLDQTHTLRFFVQDNIPRFPFLQFHTRIIYGSGYRYHPRLIQQDPTTGEDVIRIDFNRSLSYPYYGRVDMGLSAMLNTGKRSQILLKVELLNAFNNFNVLGYTWIQAFDDIQAVLPVPRILSKRFLNLGVEVTF
jgi:hypothetical protein